MFRQGDVLLVPVEAKEKVTVRGRRPEEPDGGRVVLAYGEVTGHAHALPATDAALFLLGGERLLRVKRPTALRHEEHGEIPLRPGLYRVLRQRQYTPQGIVQVAD